MKQLERLLFLQGGRCYFCKDVLDRQHASVEHLNAMANGGANMDSNCVACCKAVNSALGSLSIKEKVQVFLNQEGRFVCPAKCTSLEQITSNVELNVELIVDGEFSSIAAPPRLEAPSRPPRVTKSAATNVAVAKKVAVSKVTTAKKVPAAKKAATAKKVATAKKAAAKKVATPPAPIAPPVFAGSESDLAFVLRHLQATKCPPATEPTLKNWLKNILKREIPGQEFVALVDELKRTGQVSCQKRKLIYSWHNAAAEPNTCVTQEPPSEFLF